MKRPRPFMIRIHVEKTPTGEGLAHLPTLPGSSFRFANRDEILLKAIEECTAYIRWVKVRNIISSVGLVGPEVTDQPALCRATVVEEVPGHAVWESGTSAALFETDIGPVDDIKIRRHFVVIETALEDIAMLANAVPAEQWDVAPREGARTLRQQLVHIGNAVWWFCSRLDDSLPEPEGENAEDAPDPAGRILRLADWALTWTLSLSAERREGMERPSRFLTNDPDEVWTLNKVLRRQAEHAMEHLRALGGGPR